MDNCPTCGTPAHGDSTCQQCGRYAHIHCLFKRQIRDDQQVESPMLLCLHCVVAHTGMNRARCFGLYRELAPLRVEISMLESQAESCVPEFEIAKIALDALVERNQCLEEVLHDVEIEDELLARMLWLKHYRSSSNCLVRVGLGNMSMGDVPTDQLRQRSAYLRILIDDLRTQRDSLGGDVQDKQRGMAELEEKCKLVMRTLDYKIRARLQLEQRIQHECG